jgi:hypothetical protein
LPLFGLTLFSFMSTVTLLALSMSGCLLPLLGFRV